MQAASAASAEYAAALDRLKVVTLARAAGDTTLDAELHACTLQLAAAKTALYSAGVIKRRRKGKQPTAGLMRRVWCLPEDTTNHFSFVAHSGRCVEVPPNYRALAANLDRTEPLVIATPDTESLRRLSRMLVTREDRVVEIGCSYGACSALLCEGSPASFIGLDNSEECVRACEARGLSGSSFRKVDCLVERQLLRELIVAADASLVVVDIAGIRALADVIELVELVTAALHREVQSGVPQLVLVKSERLAREGLKISTMDAAADLPPQGSDFPQVVSCPDGWWADTRRRICIAEGGLFKTKANGTVRAATWYPNREAPCSGKHRFICRHHNYSPNGCTTTRPGGCQYDHTRCHCCLQEGHIAINGCSKFAILA